MLPDSGAAHLFRRRSPQRAPALDEVRGRLLPQLVPTAVVKDSAHGGSELVSIRHVGDLAVAFVIDQPDRYQYVQRRLMRRWQMSEADLLNVAIQNLSRMAMELPNWAQVGKGKRMALVWDSLDGYDASRLLLARQLCEAAAHVPGNPVIAVPHRDYMVMFGDQDPTFVEQMADRILEEFGQHRYPITPLLFTLQLGMIRPYNPQDRPIRVVN